MVKLKFLLPFVILVAGLLGLVMFAAEGTDAFDEGAVIENLTVVCYGILAMIVLAIPALTWVRRAELAFVLLLFGARELDLHKAFTQDSMLKSNYYLRSDASLVEKSLSILFLAVAAAIVVHLFLRSWPDFLSAVKERRDYAISLLGGLVLMGVSKAIDGISRKMRDLFGVSVDETVKNVFRSAEELFEMMIPLAFAVAAIQFWMLWRGKRKSLRG